METETRRNAGSTQPPKEAAAPRARPRVVALRAGKPRITTARPLSPRVKLKPLPAGFTPRFPDDVDLMLERPVRRRWPAHYYIIAALIHVALLGVFGYRVFMRFQQVAAPTVMPTLVIAKQVGQALAPVGPETAFGEKSRERDPSNLANAAPVVAPMPALTRGVPTPRNMPRLPTAPMVITGLSPKVPGIAAGGSTKKGMGGTADALAGRVSGSSRGASVTRYGGSDGSEAAVLKGLRWLKQNQNVGGKNPGSWGSQHYPAMTGLALLAFLGHGETHDSVEFQQAVREGLNYLASVAEQSRKTGAGYMGTARFEYQHPIAAYAICEDYAMTRYGALQTLAETSISLIVRAQRPDGSWDYDYNTGPGGVYNLKHRPSGDSSIAAWNVQALVSAKNAGLQVPGLNEALARARQWFHSIYYQQDKRFGYAVPDRGHSDALDGIGILCLQLLGEGNCGEVQQTLSVALNAETRFRMANANSTYGWYYITQAMFHAGGRWWADWNARLRDQIVENQHAEGWWPMPGAALWQDNMTARKVTGKDGKVFHTALSCMILEVYYRFLPTYGITPAVAQREVPKTSGTP